MNLTFRQYQKSLIEKARAEYPNCTLEEIKYQFQDFMVRGDHGRECFEAAKAGTILPMKVLDSLTPMQRHRIFHDLPDYLTLWFKSTGKAYIEPDKRKDAKIKYYDFRRSGFRKSMVKRNY